MRNVTIFLLLLLTFNCQAGRYIDASELAACYTVNWMSYQNLILSAYNFSIQSGKVNTTEIYLFLAGQEGDVGDTLDKIVDAVVAAGFDTPSPPYSKLIWGMVELPGLGLLGITGIGKLYLFADDESVSSIDITKPFTPPENPKSFDEKCKVVEKPQT